VGRERFRTGWVWHCRVRLGLAAFAHPPVVSLPRFGRDTNALPDAASAAWPRLRSLSCAIPVARPQLRHPGCGTPVPQRQFRGPRRAIPAVGSTARDPSFRDPDPPTRQRYRLRDSVGRSHSRSQSRCPSAPSRSRKPSSHSAAPVAVQSRHPGGAIPCGIAVPRAQSAVPLGDPSSAPQFRSSAALARRLYSLPSFRSRGGLVSSFRCLVGSPVVL